MVIKVKTGEDGKMFGSVTSGTIADELKTQFDIALERKKINLPEPIKGLGEHEVDLKLHTDVHATLKVRVESLNPPPAPVVTEAPAGEKTEKRGKSSRPAKKAE